MFESLVSHRDALCTDGAGLNVPWNFLKHLISIGNSSDVNGGINGIDNMFVKTVTSAVGLGWMRSEMAIVVMVGPL